MSKGKVAYTVICTIKDPAKAAAWVEWLKDGHMDDVISGGAVCAELVRRDSDESEAKDNGETTYEVRYIFPDRKTFAAYIKNHAPALREEGLAKFPPGDGFIYSRTVGTVI